MNYHDWEADHEVSMKWPSRNQFSQPYFPYVHDPGETFEEEFGDSQDWNPPLSVNTIGPSFPMPFSEDPCKSSLLPRATPVDTSVIANIDRTNHAFLEELQDEVDGDLVSGDHKTSLEALSPTIRNDYDPAWHTTLQTHDPATPEAPPEPSKRRRLSKSFDEYSSSLNTTSKVPRRRSQRKPPLPAKVSQSYTDISTGSSSPEKTNSNDLDSSETSLKSKRCHNLTEKKYRNRLNGSFDTLLSAIPSKPSAFHSDGGMTDGPRKKISKGEVLMLALEHIKELEKQNEILHDEKTMLGNDLERLKGALATFGGGVRL